MADGTLGLLPSTIDWMVSKHAFAHRNAGGRQRYSAPNRQAVDQHAPAFTGHFGAADNEVQRYEHILAFDRAVQEYIADGHMATADFQPFRITRDQRAGDAVVFNIA